MFVDAPPKVNSGRRRSALLPLLEQATKKPGKWCRIAEGQYLSSPACKINRGEITGLPAGFGFEAVVRAGVLYVRAHEEKS
jgi:hypothetical protein